MPNFVDDLWCNIVLSAKLENVIFLNLKRDLLRQFKLTHEYIANIFVLYKLQNTEGKG
jgi:hypothetical protein